MDFFFCGKLKMYVIGQIIGPISAGTMASTLFAKTSAPYHPEKLPMLMLPIIAIVFLLTWRNRFGILFCVTWRE